jgi:predicted protein tyrosine phosphatase
MSIVPNSIDPTNTPQSPARPWKSAFVWMVVCSLLFENVYNGCNWITAQRSGVGTWYFSWELRIPFIPAMIVPYWSLDLFFVGAFFVCANLSELHLLRNRLIAAIVIAGICFLLFPLQLAFPRPDVTGFFGLLFAALRSFDQPYNLSPSLHIALRTIIYPVYIPRVDGLAKVGLRIWFLLIGVSTIFTYQHQVIDIFTGWILAIVCLYVFAQQEPAIDCSRRMRNRRVGLYYAIGAIMAIGIGWASWPLGCILLWPSCALALVSAGYLWLGSSVYRKLGGRLPVSTRVLLGPVPFGQWLSLVYYRRQCRPWDEVVPGLLIGRQLNGREAADAVQQGVTAVLDLTSEFSEALAFREIAYYSLPILDLTAPTTHQLQAAVTFLHDQTALGKVYVHCKAGYSRSAAAVGAYLLEYGHAADVEGALKMLRKVRPSIVVRPEVRQALIDYQAARAGRGYHDGHATSGCSAKTAQSTHVEDN